MFLRKYGAGTGADILIPITKRGAVDFAVGADWTPAAGDVKISKDGGAAADIAALPVAVVMGNGAVWKFTFSNSELQAKYILITVVDGTPKAVEDQAFIIQTFGSAAAMYPGIDLTDAVRLGMSALPNAAAASSGGLPTVDAGNRVTGIAAIQAKTDNLPANPAAIGSAMTLDMTQSIPTSNGPQTVGDALNAARAQGFGNWTQTGDLLTLFAPDGVTPVHAFTWDDPDNPTRRS